MIDLIKELFLVAFVLFNSLASLFILFSVSAEELYDFDPNIFEFLMSFIFVWFNIPIHHAFYYTFFFPAGVVFFIKTKYVRKYKLNNPVAKYIFDDDWDDKEMYMEFHELNNLVSDNKYMKIDEDDSVREIYEDEEEFIERINDHYNMNAELEVYDESIEEELLVRNI